MNRITILFLTIPTIVFSAAPAPKIPANLIKNLDTAVQDGVALEKQIHDKIAQECLVKDLAELKNPKLKLSPTSQQLILEYLNPHQTKPTSHLLTIAINPTVQPAIDQLLPSLSSAFVRILEVDRSLVTRHSDEPYIRDVTQLWSKTGYNHGAPHKMAVTAILRCCLCRTSISRFAISDLMHPNDYHDTSVHLGVVPYQENAIEDLSYILRHVYRAAWDLTTIDPKSQSLWKLRMYLGMAQIVARYAAQ